MLSSVLLLEDDVLLGETLVDLLEEEGYVVTHFFNGQEALDATFDAKFDLYLLDINVPLLDGVSLLRELRGADDTTPAIFLTSHKDKSMIEQGFVSGADDYVKKPFDNDELLWRIKAVLQRSYKDVKEVAGGLRHDREHKSIFFNDAALELSQKEYALLLLLMEHIGETVPKELIFERLWSASEGGSDGAIRVYINRLKLLLPTMKIENISGVGYKLVQ